MNAFLIAAAVCLAVLIVAKRLMRRAPFSATQRFIDNASPQEMLAFAVSCYLAATHLLTPKLLAKYPQIEKCCTRDQRDRACTATYFRLILFKIIANGCDKRAFEKFSHYAQEVNPPAMDDVAALYVRQEAEYPSDVFNELVSSRFGGNALACMVGIQSRWLAEKLLPPDCDTRPLACDLAKPLYHVTATA